MDKAWRVVLVLLAFAILFLLASAIAWGERPGDTIECYGVFRDSSGVAIVPSTARFFVFLDGAVVDSSATLLTTIDTYHRVLKVDYTIPGNAPDSSEYAFAFKASGPGVTDDWFYAVPSRVTIWGDDTLDDLADSVDAAIADVAVLADSVEALKTGIAYIDSLPPSAIVDFWTAYADSNYAVIDSSDAGGIYSGSTPVTNAFVFIATDSDMQRDHWVGTGYSTGGNYSIVIKLDPLLPDTLYISAWYQHQWIKAATQFTIPQ